MLNGIKKRDLFQLEVGERFNLTRDFLFGGVVMDRRLIAQQCDDLLGGDITRTDPANVDGYF